MKAIHYDASGAERGEIDLNPAVFGVRPSPVVIHQAVVAHLANLRQGTASTLGRNEVHGTNRKPFRQKKTGNARRGDLKTNIQRGGGVWGGPKPRDYRQAMPKKQRRLALASALSVRANESAIMAVDDVQLESGKTRDMADLLRKLGLHDRRVLFVTYRATETLVRASRNLQKLHVISAESLHPYEIMWAERLLFTESALAHLTGGAA